VSRFRHDSNLSFEAGRIESSQAYGRPISARARGFVDLGIFIGRGLIGVWGDGRLLYRPIEFNHRAIGR
jgi:hypothetical protein